MAKKREAGTVLIIEDDADIQNFASRVLELEGFQVFRAGDGERGMEIIREESVSLVLLDLRLPRRDGWSILREIKGNTELSTIPVVVLTAIAETLQRKRTLRMGARKYLIKPISAQSLSKTIVSILHQSGRHQTTQKSTGAGD